MPREFVVVAPWQIEFRDYEDPPLKPGQVRIKSMVSGIKHGTEMALYRGTTPFFANRFDAEYRLFLPSESGVMYPCHLGSWLAGQVIEIGEEVSRFQVGDRVHGKMTHRPTHVRPEDEIYALPEGMNPETAIFTDPAIFALQAVHDAQIKVGDWVAIFGMGVLGLLAVQIARLNGAERVFAVDLIPHRLELAAQLGADEVLNARECDVGLEIKKRTQKKGADVAIEISGAYAALQQAIRSVHMGGLVVTAGYYQGRGDALQLGAEWHHNRLNLRSSMAVWGCPHRNYPLWDLKRIERTAVRLLESGKLVTEPLISHRFPYEEAIAAYRLIDKRPEGTVKALFIYQ
jgi:2-desacetyl-2-hydroxyethyl bacteriochlorophyllide A dehydrogenase